MSGVWFRCGYNNGCQKEVQLCTQTMPTILGLKVNMIGGGGGLYEHLKLSTIILTLIMKKYSHKVHVLCGKWLRAPFESGNHFVLIACSMSYYKWVQRESIKIKHIYLRGFTNWEGSSMRYTNFSSHCGPKIISKTQIHINYCCRKLM